MKRYELWVSESVHRPISNVAMNESADGDYVLHSDALAAIETARLEGYEARENETCEWAPAILGYDTDEADAYETSCGRTWVWFDIAEHGVSHCFGCGRKIILPATPTGDET